MSVMWSVLLVRKRSRVWAVVEEPPLPVGHVVICVCVGLSTSL